MLFKMTREVTIPIKEYVNDKIYLSIEEEVDDATEAYDKYAKKFDKMIEAEYQRGLKQGLGLLKRGDKMKEALASGKIIQPGPAADQEDLPF